MKRTIWIVAGALVLVSLSASVAGRAQGLMSMMSRPHEAFSPSAAPPAPDYANPAAWAARPGLTSGAEAIPEGVEPTDSAARDKADVFFIYPTTYLANVNWNAAYDEPGPSQRVDDAVLRNQASAFNGCCRIFAPRYRQATLAAFLKQTPDGDGAIGLAYGDVLRAFDHYIAHDNAGRPFIIASHSQGSNHAMRLLQERIIGTPLQKRLVAAYVVGSFLPARIELKGLPICRGPRQTGCVIDWNSVAKGKAAARKHGSAGILWIDGRYQSGGDEKTVCVNPLDWRADSGAPASDNLGALPPRPGHGAAPLPALVPGLTAATCTDDMLEIDIPFGERIRFPDPLAVVGIYHDLDYNLYYLNIRRNAQDRVSAFLGR